MSINIPYRVVLRKSKEGFAVWVPALPGCASQGTSQVEALENIRIAIGEYLSVVRKVARRHKISRVVEVSAAV